MKTPKSCRAAACTGLTKWDFCTRCYRRVAPQIRIHLELNYNHWRYSGDDVKIYKDRRIQAARYSIAEYEERMAARRLLPSWGVE